MNIHSIFRRISPYFRKKRFEVFVSRIKPKGSERILDVGGYPETWTTQEPCGESVDVLNIHPIAFEPSSYPKHAISTLVGNACSLEIPNGTYDVVFSNSVIEHVGTWENQVRFAHEVRRVGSRLWIQTPAREFFIEPHYIAPLVHWFPKTWQRRLLRRFTIWGWIEKPTPEQIAEIVDEIRLLTLAEMKKLFPDCEIFRERFCFFFTKSYTAYRG